MIFFVSVYIPVLRLPLLRPAFRWAPNNSGLFVVIANQCSEVQLAIVRVFIVPEYCHWLKIPKYSDFRIFASSFCKAGRDLLDLRPAHVGHLGAF